MPSLFSPKGINSASVITVPDTWSADWFRQFIRTQLSNVDIRNATAGTGIVITGNATTVATVAVSNDLQALFHQPYVLASAPSGISATFDTYRVLAPQSGVIAITDGGAEHGITVGVVANGIGNAQLRQGGATSVVGNSNSATANVADISATIDNTVLIRSSGALGFSAIPLAAFAQQANDTVVGNVSGVSAAPTALTQTQLTALVNIFTASLSGAVPASGGGTANFLRADGSFAAPAYPTAANPSATIGLTAVNGSAATFMRSDAAQALSQSIAPTWNATHNWSGLSGTAIVIAGHAGSPSVQVDKPLVYSPNDGLPAVLINNAGPTYYMGARASTINSGADSSFEIGRASAFTAWGNTYFAVGSNGSLGFNGAAPVTKPTVTGSKAANAALASLLTALASYGLVTDSST